MSHFNPITAGSAAIDRGGEGLGRASNEAELLQRAFHDLSAPGELTGDLGRLREDLRTLTTEWERLTTEAKSLFDEKGPWQAWE